MTGQGHAHTQAFSCRVALLINSCRPLGVDRVHWVAKKLNNITAESAHMGSGL